MNKEERELLLALSNGVAWLLRAQADKFAPQKALLNELVHVRNKLRGAQMKLESTPVSQAKPEPSPVKKTTRRKHKTPLRDQVLLALREHPAGSTIGFISSRLGLSRSSVGPRFAELARQGLITSVEWTDTAEGHRALLWKVMR